MMIILFLIIGFLLYTVFNKQGNGGTMSDIPQHTKASTGGIETAKVRLSKGEITVDEFEQIKNNLN